MKQLKGKFTLKAVEEEGALVGIVRMNGARETRKIAGLCEMFYISPDKTQIMIAPEKLFFYGNARNLAKNMNRDDVRLIEDNFQDYVDYVTVSEPTNVYRIPFSDFECIAKFRDVRKEIIKELTDKLEESFPLWINSFEKREDGNILICLNGVPSALKEKASENETWYSFSGNYVHNLPEIPASPIVVHSSDMPKWLME